MAGNIKEKFAEQELINAINKARCKLLSYQKSRFYLWGCGEVEAYNALARRGWKYLSEVACVTARGLQGLAERRVAVNLDVHRAALGTASAIVMGSKSFKHAVEFLARRLGVKASVNETSRPAIAPSP